MGSQLFIEFVAEIVPDFWAVIAWAPENLAAGRSLKDINFHLQQGCVCCPQRAQPRAESSALSLDCHQGLHWELSGEALPIILVFIILFKVKHVFQCSGRQDWLRAGLCRAGLEGQTAVTEMD